MNQPLPALLEGLQRSLREVLLPELTSDHARGQLAGVLDVLGKFERLLAWSPDLLRAQLQTMQAGCAAIAARAATAGLVMPAISNTLPIQVPPLVLQADLEQAVRKAQQQLIALTDWLFEPPSALATDTRSDLDRLLRETLRATLMNERRLIARADFTAMNSPGPTGP